MTSTLRNVCFATAVLIAAGCASGPQSPSSSSSAVEREPKEPAERAIEFLVREVPAWRRENGCFSCHNNGDAARALYAARQAGYPVPAEALAETTAWLRNPRFWDQNQGDPGFNDKRLADLQFAAALAAAPPGDGPEAPLALRAAAQKVVDGQDASGSWPIDALNATGSPVTYGAVLATAMAVQVLELASSPETDAARQKGIAWLRRMQPRNIPAAAAVLLAHPLPAQKSACLDIITKAQASSGGWGPYPDSPSEVFDTALVLLALSRMAPAPEIDAMIARGRAYLAARQEQDGGWPETTRPSGAGSYAQRISTTGWAVLALLETKPRRISPFDARP